MGARHVLYIHPTCPSSRSLLLGLHEKGLLDRLRVVVLDRPAPLPGGVFPWSVPLLASPEGRPLAMDPLDAGEVEALVEGGGYEYPGLEEAFRTAVLYSAFASASALAHRGLGHLLLEESFAAPALRLHARGLSHGEAVAALEPRLPRLYEESREVIARALASAIARYYYWSGGRDPEWLRRLGRGGVGALILAMASAGRSWLPWEPGEPDMTGFLAGFLERAARGLLRRVESEHREVMGDEEYRRLLREAVEG